MQGAGGVLSVDLGCRGHEDLGPPLNGDIEHDLGSPDIVEQGFKWLLDDQLDAHRRGKVDDHIDLACELAHEAVVQHRPFGESDRGGRGTRQKMLDVGRAPGGEIVEKADGIAAPDEAVSNMRPDEAGTARDQVSQFTRALALAGVDMNLSESPRSEAMFVKAMPTGNTPLVPSGRTVASKGGARAMGLD